MRSTPVPDPSNAAHTWRQREVDIVSRIDTSRRRPKPRPAGPRWRRMADYFVARWEQAVQENPRLRDVRVLETLNHCRVYMGVHFEHHTEAEVRHLIDQFVTAVENGELQVKSGQSAWMRFTATWGR